MQQTTLDNCADEPIHLPGQIQPHGALLAFDSAGLLIAWSANALTLLQLPVTPASGMTLAQVAPSPEVLHLLGECLQEMTEGDAAPMVIETSIHGSLFDCIAHGYQQRLVVEFELRLQAADAVASQVLRAQRGYDRLKRQKSVLVLLQLAVEQVRGMTGFDRVMAYRFRHDDSGEVVAEAHLPDLAPYLGQRYPASDIPAQARRLYILNTVRLIADARYQPVPLLGQPAAAPLDLSHSVLRSVSPIHLEYLHNMGVGASMSISILINGRLWGMLACHHMSACPVPYAVRMSCDVLAQVMAATVQALETAVQGTVLERSTRACAQLVDSLMRADDLAAALTEHAASLMSVFDAGAIVLAEKGKLQCHGPMTPTLAAAIVASLPQQSGKLVQRANLSDWPTPLMADLGSWVGLLGLSVDPAGSGWLLILRGEQIETVRWGGRPQKSVSIGPLGARLTPRGSFDEWRETVRGHCEPWLQPTLDTARHLLSELHRFHLFRQVETNRIRSMLLAMLSHDLRDPLHAIQMAAFLLQRDESQRKLGQRIQSSGARMQRLIGQVMDMSQLNHGAAMVLNIASFDLVALIVDLVDESGTAHPSVIHSLDLPQSCMVQADADRIAQVLSNLIGNALHHGTSLRPIRIALAATAQNVTVSVHNEGAAIAPALAEHLFDPFKSGGEHNLRNPGGMGLGLYIVHEIMLAHHGSIGYRHQQPNVVFSIELPVRPAPVQAHRSPLFARA